MLLDNVLLLEKLYAQFINDFWFDHVNKIVKQEKLAFNIQKYRSVIGYFFETYITGILHYSFKNAKHYQMKLFDELKIVKTGGEDDIADLYVRYGDKIMLGQVKSTGLYDTEKYSGNLAMSYKNGRAKFFESWPGSVGLITNGIGKT